MIRIAFELIVSLSDQSQKVLHCWIRYAWWVYKYPFSVSLIFLILQRGYSCSVIINAKHGIFKNTDIFFN